jgi:hypothetical protein
LGESKIDPVLARGLAVVLLVACANPANLTMARKVGGKEKSPCAWQSVPAEASLVRHVLVENVMPAVAGGGAGALLPAGSMRLPALLRPESDGGSSRRCTRPCPCSRSASRYPSRRRFCLDLGPVS